MKRKIGFLIVAFAFFMLCGCGESGSGKTAPDFSEGLNCEDLIDAFSACDVNWAAAPWDNLLEACEGDYSTFFECVAAKYEQTEGCADWVQTFNEECSN